MANTMTAAEAKQSHIDHMGEELGTVYSALWQEVAWVYSKWHEYVELYGTKPSRIDLLNQSAAFFFKIVQDTLWNDVLLHICRLTDPPESRGKANCTISMLPALIDDQELKIYVESLVRDAVSKENFSKDRRNRKLAHHDLELALESEKAKELIPASRKHVNEALDAIAEVLNAISCHYKDSQLYFKNIPYSNGAVHLLHVLNDGLEAEKQRQARVKSGRYNPDDFKGKDL
jgi:hypothetical protein